MDKATTDDKPNNIELTLQGARCCISIGKGVIRALGKPSHVSLKISDSHDGLSVFPCDEDDIMAFRVPTKLFLDHRCVMRINSKKFVHGIMRTNNLDITKTYMLSGEYLPDANTAVFSFANGVTLRGQKKEDETKSAQVTENANMSAELNDVDKRTGLEESKQDNL